MAESKATNFYQYISSNLINFRICFIILGDVFLRKLKSGIITQEQYNKRKREGLEKIENIKREYSDYFVFIERTDKHCIFKITDYFTNILLKILNNPNNFLSINPRFRQYNLNNDQLEKIMKVLKKPLINAKYNKKDKNDVYNLSDPNENLKEAHIDEYYEKLYSSNEDIWGLTIIKDENGHMLKNINGGTEFIKVPILKSYVVSNTKNLEYFFPYKCMVGNKDVSCTGKTLYSIVFSALTSSYVDQNTTDWETCNTNSIHNVATCYYHRSCQTLKPKIPIERIHWAYDENEELRRILDTLQ